MDIGNIPEFLVGDIDPLVIGATLGVAALVGGVAAVLYVRSEIAERKKLNGERQMADALQKLIEEKIRHGQVFFSYDELRRFCAMVVAKEMELLVKKRKIDPQTAQILGTELALKMSLWNLFPKKPKPPTPNPQEVKTMIKLRLTQWRTLVVKLPDDRVVVRNELDTFFSTL